MPLRMIHHLDLAVGDVERSLAFYLAVLGPAGLHEEMRYPTYRGTEEVVYLRVGDGYVGFRKADGGTNDTTTSASSTSPSTSTLGLRWTPPISAVSTSAPGSTSLPRRIETSRASTSSSSSTRTGFASRSPARRPGGSRSRGLPRWVSEMGPRRATDAVRAQPRPRRRGPRARSGGAGRPAAARLAAGRARGERLRRAPGRRGLLLGAHRAPRLGARRPPCRAERQRAQGDAARGVPPPGLRPRPAARRRRPRAARADGALVRQRDRHERPQHRGRRRPRAPRPARRDAPLQAGGADLGQLERRRGRPVALPAPHRPPRAAPAPRLRHAAARVGRALAALGDRARAAARLGALLQGRLGLGQRRGGPPGGAAPPRAAARWRWRS